MRLKGCELWDGGGAIKMEGCVALRVFLKKVLERDANNEQGVVDTPRREVAEKDKRIMLFCLCAVNTFIVLNGFTVDLRVCRVRYITCT